MGSETFYPEERPVRRVRVDPFWIDEAPVTNDEFSLFVAATNYVTLAEKLPDPAQYPGLLPEQVKAGSLVFQRTAMPVDLDDHHQWWSFVEGANWRRPEGANSSATALGDHPVTHIAYEDALAFTHWSGKSLPREAEWEFAARGGLDGCDYAWGDELAPGGTMLANYWQGLFPFANQLLDGWERTSPVRTFPPNGFGLFDMIGNVWEWTSDWYDMSLLSRQTSRRPCCVVDNPRGGREADSIDRSMPAIGRKVLKGGSHLCAPNYCQRYRPAARSPQAIDSSTSHIGFRCVVRSPRIT